MKPSKAAPIPSIRKRAFDEQRRVLLASARKMLVEEGAAGLSLRILARRVGASTTVVYTYFGNKEGLVRAIYEESLESLGTALEAVTGPSPLETLAAIAKAYRVFALANPEYYAVLSSPVGGKALTHDVRQSRAFLSLLGAVKRAIDEGAFEPTDPMEVCDALWGMVHGMVGLELADYFPSRAEAERRFQLAGQAMLRGFLPF